MKKVLFVCIHNSARSQIAEALLKKYYGDIFDVSSAGFEPASLNPTVIEVLKNEESLDISSNSVDSVFDFFKQGKAFNYVITVCDETKAQKCPLFPGVNHKINWSFEDPNSFKGSKEEVYNKVKKVYLDIKNEIIKFAEIERI